MMHSGQDQPTALDTNRASSEGPALATSEEAVLPAEVSPASTIDLDQEPTLSTAPRHPPKPSSVHITAGFKPLWRVWAPEVACIVLSILLTIVMAVVCARYDQRSLPDWPLSITLNTFVAFFSMAAKAAFILPVSVAISQMQWSWFLHERPLYDFYIFDQASRGPWGSLILLKHIHVKHFVSLGAFLMIVSVVTSPVTQLAISYPLHNEAVQGEATVRISQSIHQSRYGLTQMVKDGIYTATSSNTSYFDHTFTPPVKTTCFTGNCTFESYDSLGVCVEMANITSQLRYEQLADGEPVGIPLYDGEAGEIIAPGGGNISKVYLLDGLVLAHQNHFGDIMESLNGNQTYGFQGSKLLRTRIVSFVLIYSKPLVSPDTTSLSFYEIFQEDLGVQYEALEILYYACVRSYTTTVQNGYESTEQVDSVSIPDHDGEMFLDFYCPTMLTAIPGICQQNTARYNETMYLLPPPTSKQPNKTFPVEYSGMESLAEAISNTQSAYGSLLFHPEKYPEGIQVIRGSTFADNLFTIVLFSGGSLMNSTLRQQRVSNYFESVALGISSGEIRGQGLSNITGQAWRLQSHVQMNWGWISFLIVEIVLAAVFLACVIVSQTIQQRRQQHGEAIENYQDVKDSSLAYMVALGSQCCDEAGRGLRPMDELEKLAKNLKVKLQGGEIVPCRDATENESDITAGDESR
ncbi:unnamed protein product [Clonostachys rosea]|uniref:Uncharacterized protein n=1 Tax=Bionectria ochroleuca TaxID=29856 RepID=A0ABY6UB69_BIOOC|nr:unnamed protein product [Clonostachys rosea]